ncbi:alpha/beta knot [Glonium stellatum]|uniref:rRNA methyltransferase 1, mitochondrial n=1 Tax=Glonium stellatum TaxID=574774 RepID=A0A8E2EY63_9PEZI|nr:alpha/beta knot [Glonium stellatum]
MVLMHVRSSLGNFFRIYVHTCPFTTSRQISTNSAIERGIRKSSAAFDSHLQGRREGKYRRSTFNPQSRIRAKDKESFSRQDEAVIDRRRSSGRREPPRAGNGFWNDSTIRQVTRGNGHDGYSKRDTHNKRSQHPFGNDSSAGQPRLARRLRKPHEQSETDWSGAKEDASGNASEGKYNRVNWGSRGLLGQQRSTRGQENRGKETPKESLDRQASITGQMASLFGGRGSVSRSLSLNNLKRDDEDVSVKTRYANNDSKTSNISRHSPRAFAAPLSIPYTTAASEFLYGYSVVLAALRAHRRKLYNLYLHSRAARHEGIHALKERAKATGVQIHSVDDEWLPTMDRLSNGRPHNGCILESSPLPRPPISSLGLPSVEQGIFKVKLDHQSREDRLINGDNMEYKYNSKGWRYPLVLYVDGVLDEGNLGAIIRSAYFLGVDAIATPTRMSAPLNHIALKASSGAAEAIPIFTIIHPSDFITNSIQTGWRIYASDAPPTILLPSHSVFASPRDASYNDESPTIVFTNPRTKSPLLNHAPLAKHPTILMLGNEGSGLRPSLLARAHYKVGIQAGRDTNGTGIDSLNVSAASALLCFEFMKKPKQQRQPGDFLF